jgi:hypothetical protein
MWYEVPFQLRKRREDQKTIGANYFGAVFFSPRESRI